MANIAVEYYKTLFSTALPTHTVEVIDLVDRVVTDGMRHTLLLPYIENEVRVALFQMHTYKSPGPDDMSPYFFQKFWHIVGLDVISVVLSMLHSRRYLRKMNMAHIVLIPKKNNLGHISEYCLISLGNVVSKIASKVIAKLLKQILPSVIFDA